MALPRPRQWAWFAGLWAASVVLLGLVAGAAGFALYGFASTGLVFILTVPVMALWPIPAMP